MSRRSLARWSPTERPTQSAQLRLTLTAPARARSGEPVPLVFRVTNSGREPVTLQLLGRTPTADFRASDARGRIIWTLLRGQTMLGDHPEGLASPAAGLRIER